MAMIGAFDVPDDVLSNMQANYLTPHECDGCHKVLLSVKNVRVLSYCNDCQLKVGRLKRYSNSLYSPSAEERTKIFETTHRNGTR